MPANQTDAFPVADSILVGVSILLCSIVILSITSGLSVRMAAALTRKRAARASFLHDSAVLIVVVLIALAGIFLQLTIWGFALWNLDQFPDARDAFFCSANNFTSLGLDRLEIHGKWRLLGPLEAINGALMFGVTTAMLFTIMNRLAALRTATLMKEERARDAAAKQAPKQAADSEMSPPAIGSPSWFL